MADESLMLAYVAGDESAFAEIMRRWTPRLRRFVFQIVKDNNALDDILSMAFWRVHHHARSFDTTRKFSTWIYQIAKNLSYNEVRNRTRANRVLREWPHIQTEHGEPVFTPPDLRPDSRPDLALERKELLAEGMRRLARLTPEHRQVFVMCIIDGLSYEEIARRLDVPLGTVKSRLHRARVELGEM